MDWGLYNMEDTKVRDKYTGVLNGKNLIILQLEGLDSWLLNKNDTPNLYKLMNNSINFFIL